MLIGIHIREKTQDADMQKASVGAIWKSSGICIVSGYVVLHFPLGGNLEPFLIRSLEKVRRGILFIAGTTLQIYLVQFPIIERFKGLLFPLNLLVITFLIFIAASVVYWIDRKI